jgi:hypothetical protein
LGALRPDQAASDDSDVGRHWQSTC